MISIERRFRGPDRSGNGGYTAGTLADAVDAPTVTVTLRRPPPLESPLELVPDGAGVRLMDGDAVVAVAGPGVLSYEPAAPVSYDVAVEASKGYRGFAEHPFPGCFVCGPARDENDGLRLFAGPVEGRDGTVAAGWLPTTAFTAAGRELSNSILWSALDCPGGWSIDLIGRPMVLGRITATVHAAPAVDEPCVIVGQSHGGEGRKAFTSSALYNAAGTLLAQANHTWIAVDPAAINKLLT